MRLQPEPPDFGVKVRAPGRAFLRRVAHPTAEQFKKHRYWKTCLPELHQAYAEVCAYSCCWIQIGSTVDHYRPVSRSPALAYEWSNYRLSSEKLNSYKGDSTDVLDPFSIQPNWFVLNFTNFLIEPNSGLDPRIEAEVLRTIKILRLNIDDQLVGLRLTVVKEYAKGHIDFDYLSRRYPFIAYELARQGQTESIRAAFP